LARELLNTLYVTTQGAYVHLDHETLKVEVGEETKLRVPVHHLGSVVCFGRVSVSPAAMAQCAQDQRDLVFLSRSGRFRAKVVGPTSGNVLLRLAQHQAYQDHEQAISIARNIVAAKVQNARLLLMREARQTEDEESEDALRAAAGEMGSVIEALPKTVDMDAIRGHEGYAAAVYFSVFNRLIRTSEAAFTFDGRNRRPPRDPVNAILSFLYSLIQVECQAACEGVGLDPQIGFLHAVRPGRPSLALDLMEELRAAVADRLVLTLINRRQLTPKHFFGSAGGGVSLNDEGRKTVLAAYQKRKAEEVRHPVVQSKTPIGLIPHLQARLLARHLRGDMEYYPAFVAR
jgi:CRISPR-associated protein Cas1